VSKPRKLKRKIFLVDDHPLVREWLANLINQQPDLIAAGEAASAAQAMEGIGAERPDAVVVDLSLKESSGLDLIRDLKASHPGIAVLVLSVHEDPLYARRALRAGALGYVVKRQTTKKIVEALRQVLQGEPFFDATLVTSQLDSASRHRAVVAASPIEQLTDRELAVFELIGQGLGTRKIAEQMQICMKTVQAHCANIKQKLNLADATRLRHEAMRFHDDNRSA